jgi:hypothetical protein
VLDWGRREDIDIRFVHFPSVRATDGTVPAVVAAADDVARSRFWQVSPRFVACR